MTYRITSSNVCADCRAGYAAKWRERNPEAAAALNAKRDPEKLRASSKESYRNSKEKFSQKRKDVRTEIAKMGMKIIPIEYLKEALDYNPVTGVLLWKERPRHHFNSNTGWRVFKNRFAGKPAGTLSTTTGYLVLNFGASVGGYGMVAAHRAIFAMMTGRWVPFVDHDNTKRDQNFWDNLRECTKSQNQCNRGVQKNSTTGLKGVHKHTPGRWTASICKNGKRTYLGIFSSPQEAHEAYRAAAVGIHGDFANTG